MIWPWHIINRHNGYYLEGSNAASCQANGEWTRLPTCRGKSWIFWRREFVIASSLSLSLSLPLSPHLTFSLLPLFLSLSLSLACKSIKYCKVRSYIDDAASRFLECKPYTRTGYEVKLNRNGKKSVSRSAICNRLLKHYARCRKLNFSTQ